MAQYFDCGMSLLLGGGAYAKDKNTCTSAGLCAKNAGGAYAQRKDVFAGHHGSGANILLVHLLFINSAFPPFFLEIALLCSN